MVDSPADTSAGAASGPVPGSVGDPDVGKPSDGERVGVVIGSRDATPLEFWIGVEAGRRLELDDLVCVETDAPGIGTVRFFAMVDEVKKRYEGAQFDSDAFRAAEGTFPVEISYIGHAQVTRIDPEVFVPPNPGAEVRVVRGDDFQRALYFDEMDHKVAIGTTRSGEAVYANLEFLDGTRGAHLSISGVSGVATKTSYATFLLYSLFHSRALGPRATNAKAIIFNVKGEDLLWLDKPNRNLDAEVAARYTQLDLPAGPFRSVGLYAPAKPRTSVVMPAVTGRQDVSAYVWSLREFAEERLLRFTFAGADDPRAQLSYVVYAVERILQKAVRERGDHDDPAIFVDGQRMTSFSDLVDLFDTDWLDRKLPKVAPGTLDAFRRRMHRAALHLGHLIRGDGDARGRQIDWLAEQVTVVDIHTLHASAQMFVVGVMLRRILEKKEQEGTDRLVFVLLDELNKYAPRSGWSPIQEVLLDIAERGRSLGVSLFGAQQTASEVERRVVANAALKVVGRLDPAEAERGEYGFLTRTARVRATILQPGSMMVAQPELPVPLLLHFPFPSWATRRAEVELDDDTEDDDLFGRLDD